MSRVLIFLLVMLPAFVAQAGGNPGVRAYFDFDPPNYVHSLEAWPAYTTVTAYLCVDSLQEGMTAFAFRMEHPADSNPGVLATGGWSSMLPGGIIPPGPPWPYGIVEVSVCVTENPTVIGRLDCFYLGGAACLEILDHPDYPRWVVDCSQPANIDFYCVLAHASIGGGVCPDGDCPAVPVEAGSWGTIKSLYR